MAKTIPPLKRGTFISVYDRLPDENSPLERGFLILISSNPEDGYPLIGVFRNGRFEHQSREKIDLDKWDIVFWKPIRYPNDFYPDKPLPREM